jgi:hypothetical protein
VCSGWPLSQSKCPQRGFREDVIAVITWGQQSGSHEMTTLAPGGSLIIIIVLIWRGGLFCMFHLLWEVLVPCHKDVISSVLSGIQGDCKVTVKRMA